MDVKQRIREIIDSRDDLTVRGVSLSAGLSDSALHKFLTIETHSMSIANLERVAKAMGVSVRYMLFGEEAQVVNIWDRIPVERRSQAAAVLETFVDNGVG